MEPWRPVIHRLTRERVSAEPIPITIRGIGGAIALAAFAVAGSLVASSWVVLPPLLAALAVLVVAALAVDTFGLRRRATDWRGQVVAGRAAGARLAALEERFARERHAGSVHTAATARALLIAQAELDALAGAGAVVDFLATDVGTRWRRDPCGDALRALALVELGRADEAVALDRGLDRDAALAVVAWARARIALRAGAPARGLAALDRAEAAPGSAVARDLSALRVRLLLRVGRADDARRTLDALAATARPWVERLAADADATLGLAARQALAPGAAYR